MSNVMDAVQTHAAEIEKRAAAMEKAGVGLHPLRGHVAALRSMAAAMRTDAANGRVPSEFGGNTWYGSGTGNASIPPSVERVLAAAGLPTDGTVVSIENFDEAMAKRGVGIEDRIAAKRALAQLGRLSA